MSQLTSALSSIFIIYLLLFYSPTGGSNTWSGGINKADEKPFRAPHPPSDEKQFVTPHPPTGPGPSNNRARRRIPRVKSANKDRVSSGQGVMVKDIPCKFPVFDL